MDIDLENRFRSLIIYNNNFIMSLLCFLILFSFLIIYLVSFPHNDAPIIFQTVVVVAPRLSILLPDDDDFVNRLRRLILYNNKYLCLFVFFNLLFMFLYF